MKTNDNNICLELGNIIKSSLIPLIPGDYILLDLPYYSNIGDILIWKGTEDFLKELPGQCLGRHSKETFDFRPLSQDCTILLIGGGNFGDIWREHQEFRLEVMRIYPENPIIVLPQTIHYDSDETFVDDVKKMNQHSHLTICARDNISAELLSKKGFTGLILTLPDMAFCIKQKELQANLVEATQESLILYREDKELKEPKISNKFVNTFISDWPQMQELGAEAWHYLMTHKDKESDSYFIDEFFPQQIKAGVTFASSFKEASSTRLHFAILRLLLGMPVKIIDNSYGKNLSFYNTWLKDFCLVSPPKEAEQETIDLAIFFHKQELEHERLIAETIQKQKEQNFQYTESLRQQKERITQQEERITQQEERITQQEERIKQLQQKAEKEILKHKKYKIMFNATMISLIFTIIIIGLLLSK